MAEARDGASPVSRNPKAFGLLSLGCASLVGYKWMMPKSVAAVRSPGSVAVRALSLATMLSVGTFATVVGGLAAYLDVRSIAEFSAFARARAPDRLRSVERALGVERKRVAESSSEEAEWRKLDAQMKQAWDESDWTKLDALVRDSFSLYFKDDSGESPPPQG